MHFYEVWVADIGYHKQAPLTYCALQPLRLGGLVEVSLKSKTVLGFVTKEIKTQPKFAVKEITRSFNDIVLPVELRHLHTWLLQYYPAPSGQITGLFLPKNIPKKYTVPPENTSAVQPATLPPLTKEQSAALKKIASTKNGTVLLHGDTGTGKTRVYTELAAQALRHNKSAIILTPEIGLTPQLLQTLQATFGTQVIVTHSKLTDAERRQVWLKIIHTARPYIIIGPRSALFLPVKSLGLIVVDEAHDSSYKQEQSPNYIATRVAAKLSQLHNSLCVYGTATPLVADYYMFAAHNVPIIRMSEPISETIKQPKITVIDRTKSDSFKRSWLFSTELLEGIAETKTRNLSSLIFLNRRGTARLIVCNNCGWQANCPNCDLPLTYHQDHHDLRCHVCGFSAAPPLACPECQNTDIQFKAAGTKALEAELQKHFPELIIKRFDSDTASEATLEKQYEAIKRGDVDIIIGTQIIAKGLDLPQLGLVGIPFADSSLYIPDFTADEQTFHLLSQVMGRVGRTAHQTHIIVQSFNPKHPIMKTALNRDWDSFYNTQLAERKQFQFPPFRYLLQLSYSAARETTAQKAATTLAQQIKERHPSITILGPTPKFHRKTNNTYNWQIILKAQKRHELLQVIHELPPKWRHNIDPVNLL